MFNSRIPGGKTALSGNVQQSENHDKEIAAEEHLSGPSTPVTQCKFPSALRIFCNISIICVRHL